MVNAKDNHMNTQNTYRFIPMNAIHAAEIVDTWKYEGEYAFHDYSNEADHILDTSSWGKGLFAVLNSEGCLVGELTVEFYDLQDNPIEYTDYTPENLRDTEMWIGFGLKPALIGRGLGRSFVAQCMYFAVNHHQYRGDYIRLGVPAFNKRAIKVYENLGFEEFNRIEGELNEVKFPAVQMKKRNDNAGCG